MPISTYNEDGTVDVYGRKNGLVHKNVKPEDLAAIHPNLAAEYQSTRASRETPDPVTEVATREAEAKLTQMNTPGYNPNATDKTDLGETERKFAIGIASAKDALRILEEGGDTEMTGPITSRLQKAGELFGGTKGTELRATLGLANTALKSGFLGSAMSDAELESLIDAIADPSTQEEPMKIILKQVINAVSPFIGGMDGLPSESATAPNMGKPPSLMSTQQSLPAEPPNLNTQAQTTLSTQEGPRSPQQMKEDVVGGVSDALPIVGGVLGGVTGAGVGAVGGVGVGALPGGAIGTTVGTAAGIGLGDSLENLFGVQEQTEKEQFKRLAVEPVIAGTLDLATAGLFKVLASGVKLTGKVLFNVGDDLALRSIRPSSSQIAKFKTKTGVPLKDFVVKKGLFKKGVEQVDGLIKPMQSSFDDIAVKSGRQVKFVNVMNKFDDEIAKYGGMGNTEGLAVANKLAKEKALLLAKWGKQAFVGVDEFTKQRKIIDDLVPASAWGADLVTTNKNKIVRNIYQDSIREASEGLVDAAGRNLKGIGLELRKLYQFKDIAKAQENLGKGTLPFGLLKTIGLGAAVGGGSFASDRDPTKAIALTIGIPFALNQPKVISFLYNNLTKIGKAVEYLPEKEKTMFLTDVARRLLTNIGAFGIFDWGEDENKSLPSTPPNLINNPSQ